MKLKQLPTDFVVEERTDRTVSPVGEFALYRLTKTGWTTPDALAVIRKRWQIAPGRVSVGGLKDRHAHTIQHVTIFHGPERALETDRIRVEFLGSTDRSFTSADIVTNQFTVVLRHLAPAQVFRLERIAHTVASLGVPNYFDDQRFGSVTGDNQFIGRELVRGRFEQALQLALAEPNPNDRAATKREKQCLRQHWGDWATLARKLPPGHARSILSHLVMHPTDFRTVVTRLRPELNGLYLAAYQSYLWNRWLDRWLRTHAQPEALGEIQFSVGRFAMLIQPDPMSDLFVRLMLPLPSARIGSSTPELDAVLATEQLTWTELRVPGVRRPFFAKGERAACLKPQGFQSETGVDELNSGHATLTLRFALPRGAYATMIVKGIQAAGSHERK